VVHAPGSLVLGSGLVHSWGSCCLIARGGTGLTDETVGKLRINDMICGGTPRRIRFWPCAWKRMGVGGVACWADKMP